MNERFNMIALLNIGDGSTNKFEEIYHTYSRYLYAIGLKILKDTDLASDALQQCYFKIYQNIDRIKDIESKQTRSFLGIIMRNESLMIYNKYSAINHVTESLEDEFFIIDESADVEETLAKAELKREMRIYLKELSDDDSHILILRYIKEYSNDEIARLLGITGDAARQRLLRARKKLADVIIRNGGKEAINE
jgi:RNA polymerase sigma-70 factor (ECF subfamily)